MSKVMLQQLNQGSSMGGLGACIAQDFIAAMLRLQFAAVVMVLSWTVTADHVYAQSVDVPDAQQTHVNFGWINLQEVMHGVSMDKDFFEGKSFAELGVSSEDANLIYEVIVDLKAQYNLLWIYDEYSEIFFDPFANLKDQVAYTYRVLTPDQALELCAHALQSAPLSAGDVGDDVGDVASVNPDEDAGVSDAGAEFKALQECRGRFINITADVLNTLAALILHEQP